MADMAERLRTWCHHPRAASAQDLMDEAADEIERLRSENARLRGLCGLAPKQAMPELGC
jgi:hypothetical protein